ncbi:transcriptional regulator [candidate division CSSED10-310 bacterium]|uniref:Transcriptional regulator n=1 Tax=candidate division CSSED10-310 bacterium TaxID=2855610 RepID=A0ABV6YTV5_UNCC1
MDKYEEAVLEALTNAGKPLKSGEVAKATGLDSKVVAKVIKGLQKQDKVHSPKRCFYAPGSK